MHAWMVLIGELPVKEGVDRCPFGLLVPEQYGNGATIHRCDLKAGHAELHHEQCDFPGESVYGIRVTTQWQTTKHLLPVVNGNGHKAA